MARTGPSIGFQQALTPSDLYNYNMVLFLRSWTGRALFLLYLAGAIVVAFTFYTDLAQGSITFWKLLTVIVFTLGLPFMVHRYVKKASRIQHEQAPKEILDQDVHITPERLLFRQYEEPREHPLSQYQRVLETKTLLLLLVGAAGGHILRKADFPSPDDVTLFKGWARDQGVRVR